MKCDLNIRRSRQTFKSSVKYGMLYEALRRYQFGPDEGLQSKGEVATPTAGGDAAVGSHTI